MIGVDIRERILRNVRRPLSSRSAGPAGGSFVQDHPVLSRGSAVTLIAGEVPVCSPAEKLVTCGCMLVGDAITGGGIANAMEAARLARAIAPQAVAQGTCSRSELAAYETKWAKGTGRALARNYRLLQRFPPEQRNGRRFMQVFAATVGANK